jgi:glucose/arabinose dehydrogenase
MHVHLRKRLFAAVALVGMIVAVVAVGGFRAGAADVPFSPALQQVGVGFSEPLFLTHAGDGSGRIFVVEKGGTIALLKDGQRVAPAFLDIRDRVGTRGFERGLLGLAFHPDYERNGFLYVNYTDGRGRTVVERYTVFANDPNRADPSTAKLIIRIDQPFANHNGGMIAFGPDGYLYIGMGDGGGAGDPIKAGQDRNTLLGKILRIDVNNGDPYAIPADNPFVNGGGAPEIWSYGWRNPWRFSFDRATGDFYAGDVGQNAWEEISYEKAGSPGGLNYGWNTMEGTHCFAPRTNCNRDGLVLPIAEYTRSEGISVTGGYVYRGEAFPNMVGYYFFADFGSSNVWALKQDNAGVWQMTKIMNAQFAVSSFGEDEAGELYLTDFGRGQIYRLVDTK